MTVIKRRLPASNITRKTAISDAKTKLDNPGSNGAALTPATATRLNAIHASCLPGMTLLD